jgi:hypothetical protein
MPKTRKNVDENFKVAAARLYMPSGDLLEAFPDRQHGPSGDRKSLLKMAAGRAVVDN